MAKIAVAVNAISGMTPAQTTTELAFGLQCRGHQVVVISVADLSWGASDCPVVYGVSVFDAANITQWFEALQTRTAEEYLLSTFDCLFIRTNPGRDKHRPWAHDVLLDLASWAEQNGQLVLNPVSALRKASSKMFLQSFPQHIRPAAVISRRKSQILDFVHQQQEPVILKPLRGTGGSGVFKVSPNDHSNLNQIIELLSEHDYVIAQSFLPAASIGDVRLLMLEGEALTINGQVAMVARLRQGHDLRSNVAVGGKPSAAAFTPEMAAIVAAVSPILKAEGFFLAGLDIIGDKIVEINVFSPGGLRDAAHFAGVDFQAAILEAIERRIQQHGTGDDAA